jgi:hypothetical protein
LFIKSYEYQSNSSKNKKESVNHLVENNDEFSFEEENGVPHMSLTTFIKRKRACSFPKMFINIEGVHSLIIGSSQKDAKKFCRWISHDVFCERSTNLDHIQSRKNMGLFTMICKNILISVSVISHTLESTTMSSYLILVFLLITTEENIKNT